MTERSTKRPFRTLLSLPLLLALAAAGARPAPPHERAPARLAEGCKPDAPIRLVLAERGLSRGGAVDLDVSVEPLLPMESLSWELELPPDTFLAGGQGRGEAQRARGARTRARARLSMPRDAAYREVRLVARGTFVGHDQDGSSSLEEVVAVRRLVWGAPEPMAVVHSPDGPERELAALVPLPTRHQDGRPAGWRAAPRPTSATPRAALGAGFTVTGVFQYEDKAWGYGGWTNVDPILPVRRADVTVLDNVTSAVLGTGSTGPDGSFEVVCTSAGTTDVVVRVNADTDLDGAFQRIRVTNGSNVEYTAFSPVFAGHDTSLDLDVGSTTVTKILSGGDEANPFNMLDMGVDTWEYLSGPLVGAAAGSAVRIWWPEAGGSFASGLNAHISEDDGYDDPVILHELGHVVQNMYSDSDSPGGSHSFGDSDQDPRLSFGEGYATFLAGVVLVQQIGATAVYFDGNGASQSGGIQLRMRLEGAAPYTNDAFGAADEVAVAVTLYDILDDEDTVDTQPGVDDDAFDSTTTINGLGVHEAWWDVFVGPMAAAANLTLNDAWNGWFSEHGTGGLHAELASLYALRQVVFTNDADEPNDTQGTATPVVAGDQWSATHTLYSGSGTPPVPGFGDQDWYALELVQGSIVRLETRYPGGASDADTQCDTQLRLVSPSETVTDTDGGGTGRNAAFTLVPIDETGTWTVRVSTGHAYRRYGRYDYRFSYLFQNLQPAILGAVATPARARPPTGEATLTVDASDDQLGTLVYEWTPLDGGSIVGSGPSVTFVAPQVAHDATYHVEVVLEDEFGARSPASVVTVPLVVRAVQVGGKQPVGP